jgi:hypothetical protein
VGSLRRGFPKDYFVGERGRNVLFRFNYWLFLKPKETMGGGEFEICFVKEKEV